MLCSATIVAQTPSLRYFFLSFLPNDFSLFLVMEGDFFPCRGWFKRPLPWRLHASTPPAIRCESFHPLYFLYFFWNATSKGGGLAALASSFLSGEFSFPASPYDFFLPHTLPCCLGGRGCDRSWSLFYFTFLFPMSHPPTYQRSRYCVFLFWRSLFRVVCSFPLPLPERNRPLRPT